MCGLRHASLNIRRSSRVPHTTSSFPPLTFVYYAHACSSASLLPFNSLDSKLTKTLLDCIYYVAADDTC